MIHTFCKFSLIMLVVSLCSCVVEPAYPGPQPAPYYGDGYYGYGPDYYPWAVGADVDIIGGYGHGGYGHGGYGRGGGRGGGGRGGGRR